MSEEFIWHSIHSDEVVKNLNSNIANGLSNIEVKKRIKIFGTNTLPKTRPRSFITLFFRQFLSPLIYLLLAAALLANFISDVKDALVILVVVLLNAFIGSIQESRAEHSLNELKRLSKLKSRVIRDGHQKIIEASELVPGDILILESGDAVVADARILTASSAATTEASLTGESLPVSKSPAPLPEATPLADRSNMLYAGTYICAGHVQAIVVATGLKNEIGKIVNMTSSIRPEKTQLEYRIERLGKNLAFVSIVIFTLVMSIGLLKNIPFANLLMIAISQMVSIVPEGLPVALTIALAVGVQRMARKGAIVRQLSAVETLGTITIICSDKTGTLTKNEMVVTTLYLPSENKLITIPGSGYSPDFKLEVKIPTKLLQAAILCNDAQLQKDNSKWKIIGDPTEGALLTFAGKGEIDATELRKEFPRIAELPFSADDKMMATQHEIDGETIIFIKGAPEELLKRCSSIDSSQLEEIHVAIKKMTNDSLRILSFGYVLGVPIDHSLGFDFFNGKIQLLGLVGELDPPRIEVADAVRDCKSAGIRPVMITGDHKATGMAIANSLSMSRENDLAIDGNELDKLSDIDLANKLKSISVFARVHPAQKLRIVEAFQKQGEIVAMTGDGVNDAPALMRANVGVAMGITGTEVAKEAAKIVVSDDNFATIVTAIAEGRLVYQNIKKLLLFLIVTSIDELIILFLALIFGYPPPLAAVQILWINLVTEGVLTINLVLEPSEGNEMNRPPISSDQPLLDKEMLLRIPILVTATVIVTFGWFIFRTKNGISKELVQSETFTMLVVCQWFNVLNCRSSVQSVFSWSLLKNLWLLSGLILGIVLHILVLYWPPLKLFFHTTSIDAVRFMEIVFIASMVLWIEEIRKFLNRKRAGKIRQ